MTTADKYLNRRYSDLEQYLGCASLAGYLKQHFLFSSRFINIGDKARNSLKSKSSALQRFSTWQFVVAAICFIRFSIHQILTMRNRRFLIHTLSYISHQSNLRLFCMGRVFCFSMILEWQNLLRMSMNMMAEMAFQLIQTSTQTKPYTFL